jgi:hypothetical protein
MFRDSGSLDHSVARICVAGVPLSTRSATARDAGIDDVCRPCILEHIIHEIFSEAFADRRRDTSFSERHTRGDTYDDVSKRFAAYAGVASMTRMALAKIRAHDHVQPPQKSSLLQRHCVVGSLPSFRRLLCVNASIHPGPGVQVMSPYGVLHPHRLDDV